MLELLWFWHGLLKMIDWFGVKEHLAELGMQTILTCSTCNNITNVCKSGGECMHGSCVCPVGSEGKLCHVQCVGNRHSKAAESACMAAVTVLSARQASHARSNVAETDAVTHISTHQSAFVTAEIVVN